MLRDFIIGVCASIAASLICGFISKKAFGKNTDVLTTVYSIYIGFSVFVFTILLAFLLSDNIQSAVATWTGNNVFTFVRCASSLFWILFLNVSFVTIIVLIIRQLELTGKSMDKLTKQRKNRRHVSNEGSGESETSIQNPTISN